MGLGQLLVYQDIVVFILANKQRQKQTFVKRNPIRQRQTSWLFSSVAEKMNSELPRTIPASGQGGDWTRGSQRPKIRSSRLPPTNSCFMYYSFIYNKCTWILDSPIPNFAASWSRSEAEGYWLVAYAASSSSCWFLVYLMRFLLRDVGG